MENGITCGINVERNLQELKYKKEDDEKEREGNKHAQQYRKGVGCFVLVRQILCAGIVTLYNGA